MYVQQALKLWGKNILINRVMMNENIIYTLQFADDQMLLAEDYEDIEYTTRKLRGAMGDILTSTIYQLDY